MADGLDQLGEIGELRQEVQYQEKVPGPRDSYGKPTWTWTTRATFRASIRQLSGREATNAERLKIVATDVIESRYFGPASAEGRLFDGTVYYNIKTVNNVNHLNKVYQFMAETVGNPPQ